VRSPSFNALCKRKRDINGNDHVNSTDLTLLSQAYGSTPGKPNWNPQADLNPDGVIDAEDLGILGKNYGT